ncbi:MAG: hypothetical protein AABY22_26770 [Nanoarchaeota archaeon]
MTLNFRKILDDAKQFTQSTAQSFNPGNLLANTQLLIEKLAQIKSDFPRNILNIKNESSPYDTKLLTDFKSVPELKINHPSLGEQRYHPNPVPKEWQSVIRKAYERTNLPAGLLESVIMKESNMGKTSDNITGFYQKKGLKTPGEYINAAADYLKERKTGIYDSGKKYDYTDPVELYMHQYYTKKDATLDKKIFEYYFNNYKKLYE